MRPGPHQCAAVALVQGVDVQCGLAANHYGLHQDLYEGWTWSY